MGSRMAAVGSILLVAFGWASDRGYADGMPDRVINGTVVDDGTFTEVVNLDANGAACTGTVVGPRVIITAAHCALTGDIAKFKVGTKQYSATMTRSTLFPGKPHDISVGLTTDDIDDVEPATVGNRKPTVGMGITILGYGCTVPGGGGGKPDGKLRKGDTLISSVTQMDYVSQTDDNTGAVLCWGDSGGPAYVIERGRTAEKHVLVGVNSRGDINKRSLSIRTDIDETRNFLTSFATTKQVEICGINKECGGGPPPPTKPTCVIHADPPTVKQGQPLTAVMTITGTATSAKINNQSVDPSTPRLPMPTQNSGTFPLNGFVANEAGSNTCDTSYTVTPDIVPPDKPTCSLSAEPQVLKLNQTTTLTLRTQGQVNAATIDNVQVSTPVGSRQFVGDKLGSKTVNGAVTGNGGTNTCSAVFTVIKDDEPPPPPPGLPNFTVVATHCGDNQFAADTQITRACLALIKKDETVGDMRLTYAVMVHFANGTKEALPIIARKTRPPQAGDIQIREDLAIYGNGSFLDQEGHLLLQAQPGVLTSLPGRRGPTPLSLEGRTGKGKYFYVERLSLVP